MDNKYWEHAFSLIAEVWYQVYSLKNLLCISNIAQNIKCQCRCLVENLQCFKNLSSTQAVLSNISLLPTFCFTLCSLLLDENTPRLTQATGKVKMHFKIYIMDRVGQIHCRWTFLKPLISEDWQYICLKHSDNERNKVHVCLKRDFFFQFSTFHHFTERHREPQHRQ